jgi:hypothetical protein
MAGSIREKSSGTWEIRFEIGPDPANGRRRQLTRVVHGTQKQAHAALRREELKGIRFGSYESGIARSTWAAANDSN